MLEIIRTRTKIQVQTCRKYEKTKKKRQYIIKSSIVVGFEYKFTLNLIVRFVFQCDIYLNSSVRFDVYIFLTNFVYRFIFCND